MKLFALLAWYDEPISELEATIESCVGLADHIIAVDGRYRRYKPDAPAHSDPAQAAAIKAACKAHSLACTIEVPAQPWVTEGRKRTRMFELAEQHGAIGTDWLIPIDADERFTGDKQALRNRLATTKHNVLRIYYHTPLPDTITSTMREGTELRSYWQARILRLQPSMTVLPPTHWAFASHNGSKPLTKATDTITEVQIEHLTAYRTPQRIADKAAYITARNAAGEN